MCKILFAKKFIKAARKLERSGKFKQKEVNDILTLLASGDSIPASYRDHALKGDLSDRRECHIRGDILLVYRKDDDVLVLLALDIGTHHELFGI